MIQVLQVWLRPRCAEAEAEGVAEELGLCRPRPALALQQGGRHANRRQAQSNFLGSIYSAVLMCWVCSTRYYLGNVLPLSISIGQKGQQSFSRASAVWRVGCGDEA